MYALSLFACSDLILYNFNVFWYRVVTSTQLEDRRDAVRAIKALAKKYKTEVGDLCTLTLLDILNKDKSDSEIVGYALESLWYIMEIERLEEGEERESRSEVGFSETLIRSEGSVPFLLELLGEFDFQVRRPATVLLWTLLQNCRAEMQDTVLLSPMGISRMMDLLVDSREVIRNDAILVLLELTKSNKQIQKIVAFENAFDRLLAIVQVEGYSEGGIVVLDCINVLQNLLHENNSNQSFFREASLISHLLPFFNFKPSSPGGSTWNQQEKVLNVLQMLKLIRMLVSPKNPHQSTASSQKLMLQCGLLPALCVFMFAGGVPSEILRETISTVAEVIRGSEANQQYLESVSTPSNPPRSAILAILMSMVTEKQPLPLRLSALYCFQCYVYKNESSQQHIIDTLLPSSTAQQSSISPGQILIAGLFGPDPLSNWCTAIAVSDALNDTLKPQLLRVQLSMQGGAQVTLLQQLTMFLSQHSDLRVQTRVGLLILLCTWLANCNLCVTQFLNDTNNIPFLIGQLDQNYSNELGQLSRCLCAVVLGIVLAYCSGTSTEYSQATLRQVIEHRVGKDAFVECIRHVSNSELFTSAAKNPHNRATSLQEVCFDHNFTVFFKQISEVIVQALESDYVAPVSGVASHSNGNMVTPNTSVEEHDSIINQYKELIRDQDEELTSLRGKHTLLEKVRSEDARLLLDQATTIKTLEEQISYFASLKSEMSGGEREEVDGGGGQAVAGQGVPLEIEHLQGKIMSLQRVQDSHRHELAGKEVEIGRLQQQLDHLGGTHKKLLEDSIISKNEMAFIKDELNQVKSENEALLTDRKSMEEEMASLEEKFRSATVSASQQPQQQEVDTPDTQEVERLRKEVEKLKQDLRKLQASFAELSKSKEMLESEQEDLLVLLSENDMAIKRYKGLLVEKGIDLPESEEEEEEEEEDRDVD